MRRGKVGQAKGECGNRGMQQHMERMHKDEMEGVKRAQAEATAAATGRVYDARDETVRGTVPLFNLKTRAHRAAFMKKIQPHIGDDVEKNCDWGILSMIVLDLMPFNIVNK